MYPEPLIWLYDNICLARPWAYKMVVTFLGLGELKKALGIASAKAVHLPLVVPSFSRASTNRPPPPWRVIVFAVYSNSVWVYMYCNYNRGTLLNWHRWLALLSSDDHYASVILYSLEFLKWHFFYFFYFFFPFFPFLFSSLLSPPSQLVPQVTQVTLGV